MINIIIKTKQIKSNRQFIKDDDDDDDDIFLYILYYIILLEKIK